MFPPLAGCMVVFLVLALWYGRQGNKEAEEKKQKNKLLFFEECRKYKIYGPNALKNEQKKLRVLKIAELYKLSANTDEELTTLLSELAETIQKEKNKKSEEQKNKEIEEYNKSVLYAGLHGLDKPIAILDDEIKSLYALANGTTYIPNRKTSDGTVMAGMAAGIGGTVPALMSLDNTAKYNKQVNEYNSAVNTLNRINARIALDFKGKAIEKQKERDKWKLKLTKDLPKEDIFELISITNKHVSVSKFGTIKVKCNAKLNNYISIYKVNAIADGYLIAEIYETESGEKIADVPMVFGLYGCVPENVSPLIGMYLFNADPKKKYEAKILPGDLWAVEV